MKSEQAAQLPVRGDPRRIADEPIVVPWQRVGARRTATSPPAPAQDFAVAWQLPGAAYTATPER